VALAPAPIATENRCEDHARPVTQGVASAYSMTAAYWALFVIILATFVTFFEQVVFAMLAERIKADFGLSDSQLGFLASRLLASLTSFRANSCWRAGSRPSASLPRWAV